MQETYHDNGDLCSHCAREGFCSLRAEKTGQVFSCEEYEAVGRSDTERGIPEPETPPNHESSPPLGLCLTCKNQQQCIHRKRNKQAVWHCEDYE